MIQQLVFSITTPGRGMIKITPQIMDLLAKSQVETGLCHLFIHHTSAGLLISENADPDVQTDLESFFSRLVSDGDPLYRHIAEGKDDMPSHIRTMLTETSLSIPIAHHQLDLGTWQGIFLFEHRLQPHLRKITVTFIS